MGQFPVILKKPLIKRDQKEQNRTDKRASNWRGKRIITFGTWNVRGISGKEVEVEEVLEKAGMAITVLTETKKKGTGSERMQGGSMLFYAGVPTNIRAQAGVAIVVRKDLIKHIKDWSFVNERIMTLEITNIGIIKKMTIIAAYGHNEDESVEKRSEFFKFLQNTIDSAEGETLLMGDFNGKVGNSKTGYKSVIGQHGESVRTSNGKLLLQLCISNGFVIHNTRFPHKEIHKWTRTDPQKKQRSIIDYVIGPKATSKYVRDARVMRGPEIGTDHYLVILKRVTEGKIKVNNKNKKRKNVKAKIKVHELKNVENRAVYQRKVADKIKSNSGAVLVEEPNLEGLWQTFKAAILEAAEEVCGKTVCGTARKKTRWWTNDIKQAVKEKKETWKLYLQTKNLQVYKEYQEKRRKVKNMVKEAKKKAWQEFGEFLEQSYSDNQKLFYKVLKNMRKEKECPLKFVKDKEGKMLTDENKIMGRWREYFAQLLGGNETQDPKVEESARRAEEESNEEGDGVNEDCITKEEVLRALAKMKLSKAAGADAIAPEMLKYMGPEGEELLYQVIKKAWCSKKIPKDWETAIIIPIFKKGDNRDCGSHRGISLLSVAGKLYSRVLEERLRAEVEPLLDDVQCGFRPKRSTQDLIFSVRQLIEKTTEYDKKVHLCFIDLEKAFDSVPWLVLWASLERKGISRCLIERIKSFYSNCLNVVRTANSTSREFNTHMGVRQGDILSPLLFIILMDDIIKSCQRRTKGYNLGNWMLKPVTLSAMAFADDLVLVAETAVKLQKLVKVWSEELETRGLKINADKTKTMIISRQKQDHQIFINGKQLEQVNSFKYLGIMISSDGKCREEIEARIAATGRLYHAINRGFLSKAEVSQKTKLIVFKTVYMPTLTYGCESWTLTEKSHSRIQATEMRYLRKVAGKTRRDRVRNSTIRQGLDVQQAKVTVENAQLRWFGHVNRMGSERLPRKVFEARIEGRRPRGRRRTSWMDNITSTLTQRGQSVQSARSMSLDRKKWRNFWYSSTLQGRRGID